MVMHNDEDAVRLRQQRHFFDQLDQSIHDVNREVIHGLIPKLDRETFRKMAETVAKLRVKYIASAVQLSTPEAMSHTHTAQLKQMREQFEEARAAFDAAKRAITRGYIDMAD